MHTKSVCVYECISVHTTIRQNSHSSLSISSRGDRNREEAADMGLGASHMGPSAPSHRVEADPRQRRRSSIRRSISSFLLCGASSSPSHVMEDCPAELLVTSADIGDGERLKDKRKGSDLTLGRRAAPVDITKNRVSSSGRRMNRNEIPALQTLPCNVGPGDKGKCLSESGKIIPCKSTAYSGGNDTESASYMVQPSLDCVSATEIANFDAAEDINRITRKDFSEIKEAPSNSNHPPSHGYGESSLDEVLAGNSIAETIDSNSEDGSSSLFSDSPIEFHLMQNDNLQGLIAEFIVSEREQNRQEGSLLQGDLMGVSSNILLSNSVEIDVHDIWNYRRSFSLSRNSAFSTDESDYSGSPDGSHHDFSGDFFSSSLQGSLETRGSGTHGNNELGWNSRSEFWEGLHGNLDSTDTPTDVCPRRIHVDSSTEESGSPALSRIVLLAQTLFEVLDQIHQQPMSLSLSMASLPAPESVVDSLPVKIHRKEKILGCAEDVSRCHICLAAYEEGDKIRVLPCQHEYHMSCVDKWLHEIHGVCPLCRGDVCKGVTEVSCPNLEILPL